MTTKSLRMHTLVILSSFCEERTHKIIMVYITPNILWKNETVCFVRSTRIWPIDLFVDQKGGTFIFENLLNGSLTLFNIQLLLIIVLSSGIHFLLRNFGITSFVSQCLVGVILGPTFMAKCGYYKEHIFSHGSQEILDVAAKIGYSLFLFTIGVKTDVRMILRCQKKIMILGITSVLLPEIITLLYQLNRISASPLHTRIMIMSFSGIQSITSFPVVFHLLVELRLTNSELGRLALSCSLISELVSTWLEMSFAIVMDKHGLVNIGMATIWVMSAAFVLHPIMMRVVKRTPPGSRFHPACMPVILAVAFIYQILFDLTTNSQHLGPLIVGLAIPVGTPLGSSLVDCLETMTNSVLFPLFMVTSGMRAGNLIFTSFDEFPDTAFYITSIVVSLLVKFGICLLVSLTWMLPVDSVVLALIMSSKGMRELGIYSSLRDFGKPHHVGHMINLLDVMRPTQDDQIRVYALHLVELVGRATPMLISHHNQRVMSDNCSIEVIIAFNQFERRTFGRTSVNNFTSISQSEFMHDDICTLALDNSTSLILIPFHVTWALHGGIESEDASMRMLNSKVLGTAPCSVGIFFNRGNNNNTIGDFKGVDPLTCSYSVCVIYIGGRDDHEALCVAMRMVKESAGAPHDKYHQVELTILHLIAKERGGGSRPSGEKNLSRYERLADDVVLEKALKEVATLSNVRYVDEVVEDGHQTAMAIRSRAENHDLFLVGRRQNGDVESPQTVGLDQWSEFPELGVVGDLLASKNMKTKGGVLIMQQQRKIK
ncbi:Cation/H(+) antiporter 4 [Linum grandiflorum]